MPLNPDAVGFETEPGQARWTSKDSLLYALGVGAGVSDPTGFELEFTTENSDGIGGTDGGASTHRKETTTPVRAPVHAAMITLGDRCRQMPRVPALAPRARRRVSA